MTEREALLAAILANPTDDVARLVFADWLEENNEEQYAEFIRAEIAGEENLTPPPWGLPEVCEIYVSRGLIDSVVFTLDDWVRYGPALVREHPIRFVSLVDKFPVEIGEVCYFRFAESPEEEHEIPEWLRGFFNPERIHGDQVIFDIYHWEYEREFSRALINWAKAQKASHE
jgi:uncharacterized protein (TIGR02996 family)